jgi:ERF superfamily
MADGLMSALLAVQREAPKLQKSKLNPAFRSKYLTLEKLMQQVLPVLNAHGLVWVTLPCVENGEPTLHYGMHHVETGEKLEGKMPLLLTKKDRQGQGSGITYARRYALMAVLGLVADEDDDGNRASQPQRRQAQPSSPEGVTRVTLATIRSLIKTAQPSEESVRLALLAVDVEVKGTVSDALKGLTEKQAIELLSLLTNSKGEA